jgi:hypothetical protein
VLPSAEEQWISNDGGVRTHIVVLQFREETFVCGGIRLALIHVNFVFATCWIELTPGINRGRGA